MTILTHGIRSITRLVDPSKFEINLIYTKILPLSLSGLSLFQNGESRRVRDDRFLPEGNAAKGKQY